MINFTKMHGLGNDYVYIDCTSSVIFENGKLVYKR